MAPGAARAARRVARGGRAPLPVRELAGRHAAAPAVRVHATRWTRALHSPVCIWGMALSMYADCNHSAHATALWRRVATDMNAIR